MLAIEQKFAVGCVQMSSGGGRQSNVPYSPCLSLKICPKLSTPETAPLTKIFSPGNL